MTKLAIAVVLLIIGLSGCGVKHHSFKPPTRPTMIEDKESFEYQILTNIEGLLLGTQKEFSQVDIEGKSQMNMPKDVNEAYVKAVASYNKANESWHNYKLAVLLGINQSKTYERFGDDLRQASLDATGLQLVRGIKP